MKKRLLSLHLLLLMIFVVFDSCAFAQTKPYAELIPASATKHQSFLTLNRVGNNLFLELPDKYIGVDMLFVRYIGGYRDVRVRWEKLGDTIILRISPALTINETTDSAYIAWTKSDRKGKNSAVTALFPIESISNKGAYVIDVTILFTFGYDLPFPIPVADSSQVKIVNVAAHRDDLIVEVIQPKADEPETTKMALQLVRLPEMPMKPRLFDSRVGFFGVNEASSYVDIPNKDEKVLHMLRYRLEKRNPDQKFGEPVRPLIIYIPKNVSSRWRKYVRAAIEDWAKAFEAAGFKNAIIAKDEPENDSTFSLHDLQHSYIDWKPKIDPNDKSTGGGGADHIVDRRTGEILKVVVGVDETIIRKLSNWYFTQCAPLDARTKKYPFPDDLVGEQLRNIISHELGHGLGLMDGNYGKYAYPVDSLRSTTWLNKMAHTPSVMNYSRNNYVAQPEDHIDPINLIQRVGPADIFNIRWGYTIFPSQYSRRRKTLYRGVSKTTRHICIL